jgi:transposase
MAVPVAERDSGQGRPALDGRDTRHLYDAAVSALLADGCEPTIEAIAERLDRSPRTVRGWKQRFGL